jgi:CHAT domain-containing protein
MFSLDGPLRYIPMSALYDGEKWLTEKYRTTLFIETARHNLKDAPNKLPLANGFWVTKEHPPFSALNGVKGELDAITTDCDTRGGILTGNSFLDENFTIDTLKEALWSGASILHIASHFQFAIPLANIRDNSYLLLGDGTLLTVANIKDEMNLGTLDLLTLSACNTATGIVTGEGVEVESIGNKILKLGTKAVLVPSIINN